jgi:hypothetical protein
MRAWINRWLGIFGAISLLEPIWRAIKWLLHWLGDFDFVIFRIEDPDWMGPVIHFFLDPPGWVTFPALFLGVGLLYFWNAYRRSATSKSSSNAPKGFCEVMEAIWWVADQSSWGRWQRMQRGIASGSAVLENGILHTAEYMLRTSAQNGELTIYGRLRNTTEYVPIDQHFWRLVFFNIEKDDRALLKATLTQRADVTTPIPDYDSFIVEGAALESLPWLHGLRLQWVIAKLWIRAKLQSARKVIGKVEPSHILILGLAIAAVGLGWQLYRGKQSAAPSQEEISKLNAPLQNQIDSLKAQLAERSKTTIANIPSAISNVAPLAPTLPKVVYTPTQVVQLIDALQGAFNLMNNTVKPLYDEMHDYNFRFGAHLASGGPRQMAENYVSLRVKIQAMWGDVNKFIYDTHPYYKEEMRVALNIQQQPSDLVPALEYAAEGMRALPDAPSDQLLKLFTPQRERLKKAEDQFGGWIGGANTKITFMTDNLRRSGVTGYETK